MIRSGEIPVEPLDTEPDFYDENFEPYYGFRNDLEEPPLSSINDDDLGAYYDRWSRVAEHVDRAVDSIG